MTKHCLYITFDGLSDPLGQSQILPYLKGLASAGFHIHILSCEKIKRLQTEKAQIDSSLAGLSISWQHVLYDEQGGVFTRWLYTRRLAHLAKKAVQHNTISLIHCRSYLASLIGIRFKKKYAIPFVFDMRGLWANERIDGGIWKLNNPLHYFLFKYFKYKERQFLNEASAVVSLTQAGLTELQKLYPGSDLDSKTVIIPCCCDTQHFKPDENKPGEDHLLVYTGSIGTWYYTREMIECLSVWKRFIPRLKLLVITRDQEALNKILETFDEVTRGMVFTRSAAYSEMPLLLSPARASIFFIKPAYSKVASSPTKMAECWSMDLPLISNAGVGDNDWLFEQYKGGILLKSFTTEEYESACKRYLALQSVQGHYRQIALEHFDHRIGIKKYLAIYRRLAGMEG